MRKTVRNVFCIAVCAAMIAFLLPVAAAAQDEASSDVKSVIMLIPDGMSVTDTTVARWYNGGVPLAMDKYACGLVRTYNADTIFTDSAPAGTAYACGIKSNNGYVAVEPTDVTTPGISTDKYMYPKKPAVTVLEAAKHAGKATGIVVTCQVNHATPADFAAHTFNRNLYEDIIEQEVYQNMDVVLGGGSDYLDKNKRADKEDLVKAITSSGYDYVTDKSGMDKSTGKKIWGAFAPVSMDYDIDRDTAVQPSLEEMAKKALDVVSKNPKGFFLMIEGSEIDWGAHANDPIAVISDTLAFDKAVNAAMDFAKADGYTAVVVCADHTTGGMVLGYNNEWTTTYDSFSGALHKAVVTGQGLEKKLKSGMTPAEIRAAVQDNYGIFDLTDDEVRAIAAAAPGKLNSIIGPMFSKRHNISWSSGEHTGEEVVLYAYSPDNYKPTDMAGSGIIDNTDVGRYIEKMLGSDLASLEDVRFVYAKQAFEAKRAVVSVDNTDPRNPVLVVKKTTHTLRCPVNKNYVFMDGRKVMTRGLTIYTDAFYVPASAVDLIK